MDPLPRRIARVAPLLRAPALIALVLLLASGLLVALPTHVSAQGAKPADAKKEKAPKEPKAEKEVPLFFRSEAPLAMTLTTNIKRIRADKGENAPWRPATWT